MRQQVWIGAAAGFAGDRADTSGPLIASLARHDGPRFLIFETLAERTLALAQLDRLADPARGEVPALKRLLWPALAPCAAAGIKIIGNFGGANPFGAAAKIKAWAAELGCSPKIAVVTGDDLRGTFTAADFARLETDGTLLSGEPAIISANAYLGADAIAAALAEGADIVVTGRVADPALVLGPENFVRIDAPTTRPKIDLDDWRRSTNELLPAVGGAISAHGTAIEAMFLRDTVDPFVPVP